MDLLEELGRQPTSWDVLKHDAKLASRIAYTFGSWRAFYAAYGSEPPRKVPQVWRLKPPRW